MVDIFSDQFSLTTLLATKNLSNWTVTSDLSGRRKEWIVKLSSVRESFTLAKKKRIALKRILRGIFLSVSECSFFPVLEKEKDTVFWTFYIIVPLIIFLLMWQTLSTHHLGTGWCPLLLWSRQKTCTEKKSTTWLTSRRNGEVHFSCIRDKSSATRKGWGNHHRKTMGKLLQKNCRGI